MASGRKIDQQVVDSLLELYSVATGYAVILYEDNRLIIPPQSRALFNPYCQKLHSYPQARQWCEADHRRRGANAEKEGFEICHAGLFNYTLPIRVEDRLMGTLLCGQVRLSGGANEKISEQRRNYLFGELRLGMRQRGEMEQLYGKTQVLDLGQKDPIPLVHHLRTVQRQYYELLQSTLKIQREAELFEQGQENIAHEFQVRLQGLLATGANLRKDLHSGKRVTPRMLDDANELVLGVSRLNVLVQNLKLGLGEYEFQLYDLKNIVKDSLNLYSSEADRKQVSFEVKMAGSTELELSPRHIGHVMDNLVCNAVKYSYSGTSLTPRFVLVEGRPQGDMYETKVQNYGIGILPEELDKIFEKGYRGILTADERRTGAGWGLAIAREIVESHGGTIRATSHRDRTSPAYITNLILSLPFRQRRGRR